jgi:hypothetical protein
MYLWSDMPFMLPKEMGEAKCKSISEEATFQFLKKKEPLLKLKEDKPNSQCYLMVATSPMIWTSWRQLVVGQMK